MKRRLILVLPILLALLFSGCDTSTGTDENTENQTSTNTSTDKEPVEDNKPSNKEYKLIVENTTTYDVELRKNGVEGEVIASAPAQSPNITFYLSEGTYTLYPVFLKYSASEDCLYEIIPRYPDTHLIESLRGMPKSDFFTLGDGEYEEKEHTFIAADFTD